MPNLEQNNKFPKILIVGTTPYSKNESSRALDTYFANWPKSSLRMVFSSIALPTESICESLYQITDIDVFKNFFRTSKSVGRVVDSLDTQSSLDTSAKKNSLKNIFKKNNLRYYLRKIIWSHKRWLSKNFIKWCDEFSPDAIYLAFSDDVFILQIALYLSIRYDKPIISQISDDYYFKKYPLILKPYVHSYKKIFHRVMDRPGFNFYIFDNIANKYNETFSKKGFPVYLGSDIVSSRRSSFLYEFNYFGKIDNGRAESLSLLGNALHNISEDFYLNIYTDSSSKRELRLLKKSSGCILHKKVSYEEVTRIMGSGSFNVVASAFNKKRALDTKYSLSTKVADCLVCGSPFIAIGLPIDGAISYCMDNKCALILNNKDSILSDLKSKLYDSDFLEEIVKNAIETYQKNHVKSDNYKKFERSVVELCR